MMRSVKEPKGTERPIRIAHIVARMNVGGPAQILVGLLRHLDDNRFEQTIIVGSVGPDEQEWFELRDQDLAGDERIVRIPELGPTIAPLRDLRTLVRLVGILRQVRPDVVQTHTAKAGLLGRLAAMLVRCPVVIHTYHGHTLHGYFPRPMVRAMTLADRALARRTDHLVAVGARVRDELLQAGIGTPKQFTVIPPGVSPEEEPDRQASRTSLGLDPGATVVTFAGRLTGVKRPDRFLEMADLVAAELPGTVFLIVGDGEMREALEKQERVSDVRFLGWRGDMQSVYSASDIVVVTSDNEGMPLVLIEASAAGRCCVTTDVGSAAEVVAHEETGLVVGSEAVALAAAVERVLKDDATRATYAAAARRRAHAMFGIRAVTAGMEPLYGTARH